MGPYELVESHETIRLIVSFAGIIDYVLEGCAFFFLHDVILMVFSMVVDYITYESIEPSLMEDFKNKLKVSFTGQNIRNSEEVFIRWTIVSTPVAITVNQVS